MFSFVQVMRGQPKTEQVGKRFIWCQWDSLNQQLMFIHQRKDGKDDGGKRQHMLTCVLFYSSALYDNVVCFHVFKIMYNW